jgi:hypothetical protein
MTLQLPASPWKLVTLVVLLLAVVSFAWTAWQLHEISLRSEQHHYTYSIDLTYTTEIDNVTLFLPVPEQNKSPRFMLPLLNRTAYGVPPDWDLSLVSENGTPMLAIRAARMVPEYHGYPIAIDPGTSILPATRVPGHEYAGDTPVLMPVTIAVMETSLSAIDTRDPIGHEPLFFPEGSFTTGSCNMPVCDGALYHHPVPVYIRYTAERPVVLSLRVSVQGSNAIWRGGWQGNTYSDSVFVEIRDGSQGWINGNGTLRAAGGVYY